MPLHHGSIRKYTAALLDFFNNITVQNTLSSGESVSKQVPLKYSSREKAQQIDEISARQFLSGNYNFLPRASLAMVSMTKANERITNKNAKLNFYRTDETLEFMHNSVPYEFSFEIIVQCRGMNEATQIVEQIAPKFNPTVNLDIWDAQNLNEPTRVPVRLDDIQMSQEEYEELSTNLVMVTFAISLHGNLYPPIRVIPRVQEFQMYLNQIETNQEATRKEMLEWDVDLEGKIGEGGLYLYAQELTSEIHYNPNEEKPTLSSERIDVSKLSQYFNSTTLDGILEEIATKTSGQRIDNYVESLDATNIVYSDGTKRYLLPGDLDRPSGKIAYTEYGTGDTDPLTSISYNTIGKVARVDYYINRQTFSIDGSGRNGYTTFKYNSFGKLVSSKFTPL
jgi:hypothetical protein